MLQGFAIYSSIHQKVIGQPSQLHCRSITMSSNYMSFNYISFNYNVEPSILSSKCIVTQAPCSQNSLSSTKRPFCRRGWLKSEQFTRILEIVAEEKPDSSATIPKIRVNVLILAILADKMAFSLTTMNFDDNVLG